MKKFVSIITMLVMLASLPIAARATETDMRGETIRIEYADFCGNEDLYWSYVQNGATVMIHLDEAAREKYGGTNNCGDLQNASDNTRGLTMPTSTWNVIQNGIYTIPYSYAYSGPLYSERLFTGVYAYGAAFFNWSDTDPVTVYALGAVFDVNDGPVTIDPGYCTLQYYRLKYQTGSFYLYMPAPVDGINGYVGEYQAVRALYDS